MESKYWIALSEHFESSFIIKLYNHFGSIEKAFNASANELKNTDKKAEKFIKVRDSIDIDKSLQEVLNRNIFYVTYEDKNYPSMLKNIDNPPAIIYYRGELSNLDRTLAVVGSRRASYQAKEELNKIISEFKGTDICIVSGLAAGIDTQAHLSALDNGLKTIGVIASGLDFYYPAANKQLYQRIENGCGAVISEYYPTLEPLKFRFPQRNRIVSGLSYGTLVAEASLKSGALITANLTLEQGRELMCMPGLISNPNTQGIYKLLKSGATLVTCADDILNALNWEIKKEQEQIPLPELTEDEQKILQAVEIEEKCVDELMAQTGFSVEKLLSDLTTMELKGIIKQVSTDRYKKV